MTAVNSISSGLFASAFAKQSINNTEKSNVDSKSQVAQAGENTTAAKTSFLGAITPAVQIASPNKEASTVNATGLNTAYKNSALFAGNTVGVNEKIPVGGVINTNSQVGVAAGTGRTLCFA